MALVNSLLASVSYAMAPAGASGFSTLALSYVLSAPNDFWPANTFCVGVVNTQTVAPLHVELRTTWTDINGVSQTTPLTVGRVSNTQTYGGSALYAQTLTLLLSGQNAIVPYDNIIGSAIQVWLLAASTTATNQGASGSITLWRSR